MSEDPKPFYAPWRKYCAFFRVPRGRAKEGRRVPALRAAVLRVDIRRGASGLSDHREDVSAAARAVVLHFGSKLSHDVLFSDRLERLLADARHQDAGCLRKNFSFFGCLEQDISLKRILHVLPSAHLACAATHYGITSREGSEPALRLNR
jgi:hypothetical protein